MINVTMLTKGSRSAGTESDVQMRIARVRAIRKAWHGKAMRKSCAAQADSSEGSAKAPVTRFIATLATASSGRSGSCSLRAPPAKRGIGTLARGKPVAGRSVVTRNSREISLEVHTRGLGK